MYQSGQEIAARHLASSKNFAIVSALLFEV